MDDAGVYGRTAKADKNKAHKRNCLTQRKKHREYSPRYYPLTQPDKLGIIELCCKKAVKRTAHSDAKEKNAAEKCRGLAVNTFVQHKVRACPEAAGLLKSAVTEEAEHYLLYPRDGCYLRERQAP